MSKASSHSFNEPPQSTEYCEQVDEVVTKLLNLFVSQQQLMESAEQQARRREVINDIEQKISQWVYDTYSKIYSQYMTEYRPTNPATRLAIIQPYGSYFLETHNSASDIDTVVIFPSYVSEQTFFETFPLFMKQTRGVTRAVAIIAKHPIVNMIYNGYEIDIQPAKLTQSVVSREINWLDQTQFEGCSQKSKQVISAVTTNARVKKMMETLGLFPVFQQLVRILKYGFDQMLVTGNKIGYFGGINIVLLAANVMFIKYYCRYDFKKPVILCEDVGYIQKDCPMQIITVTKPEINSTNKVTESTKDVIQRQLNESRKSFEYMIKLVATAMKNDTTRILLKPELCKMMFCKLVPPKKPEGQIVYKIMEFSEYFFKDPELKNVMMVQLTAPTQELLEKVKEKLEPLLVFMLKSLEELKSENAGMYAKISFTRPRPGWKDVQENEKFKSSFYIGIAKTEGEKDWLIEKLQAVTKNFKLKCRMSMDQEPVDVQNIIMDMKIDIVNQKMLAQ